MSALESIRRGAGESQKYVAALIGVDVRTYQNKEKGITEFKLSEMFIIARHYNRTVDDIFSPSNFEKHEIIEIAE